MDTPEWQLEKRFWLEGAPVYETHLHENALMIFPEAGILDRAAVIESLQVTPRWESVEMSEQRTIRGGGRSPCSPMLRKLAVEATRHTGRSAAPPISAPTADG
ncbi:MAG: hypothetical protein WA973_00965 [Mesorhizobium sp.]